MGRRSFGSTLLVAGLLTFAPLIGAAMPLLEFIPYSATVAGLILTLMSLALVVRDGLLALVTLTLAAAAGGLLAVNLC